MINFSVAWVFEIFAQCEYFSSIDSHTHKLAKRVNMSSIQHKLNRILPGTFVLYWNLVVCSLSAQVQSVWFRMLLLLLLTVVCESVHALILLLMLLRNANIVLLINSSVQFSSASFYIVPRYACLCAWKIVRILPSHGRSKKKSEYTAENMCISRI